MAKAMINRVEAESADDPRCAVVNPVYDFLARNDYQELTPRQRVAQLALFYDNEVNNGGHLQYFHNQGMEQVGELLSALGEIGAACQREIFERALKLALEHPVEQADSLEDYAERAYEQEFWDYDKAYYACRPELGNELLPNYVQAHVNEFVEWE